jgi:hypothetical protein
MEAGNNIRFFFIVFTFALSIPTIHYGFKEKDADCQHDYRYGMLLSNWVQVIGIEKFILSVVTLYFLSCRLEILFLVMILCDLIFSCIWVCLGLFILVTKENNECVNDGNPMAIVAILNLLSFSVKVYQEMAQ